MLDTPDIKKKVLKETEAIRNSISEWGEANVVEMGLAFVKFQVFCKKDCDLTAVIKQLYQRETVESVLSQEIGFARGHRRRFVEVFFKETF